MLRAFNLAKIRLNRWRLPLLLRNRVRRLELVLRIYRSFFFNFTRKCPINVFIKTMIAEALSSLRSLFFAPMRCRRRDSCVQPDTPRPPAARCRRDAASPSRVGIGRLEPLPALLHHTKIFMNDGACRGAAQTKDHFRLNNIQSLNQPGQTGFSLFRSRRTILNAPAFECASATPDDVANIDVFASDAVLLQTLVQQRPRHADEGPARSVFVLPGSFADQDKRRVRIALPEDDVFASLRQPASGACRSSTCYLLNPMRVCFF